MYGEGETTEMRLTNMLRPSLSVRYLIQTLFSVLFANDANTQRPVNFTITPYRSFEPSSADLTSFIEVAHNVSRTFNLSRWFYLAYIWHLNELKSLRNPTILEAHERRLRAFHYPCPSLRSSPPPVSPPQLFSDVTSSKTSAFRPSSLAASPQGQG